MQLKTAILAALSIFALSSGAGHAQTLSLSTTEAYPGDTTRVKVSVDAAVTSLTGIQYVLDFGAKLPATAPNLTISTDEEEEIYAPLLAGFSLVTNPSATSLATAAAGVNPKKGPGAVLSVPFVVPANAPVGTKYTFRLRNVVATDSTGKSITLAVREGSLTVANRPVLGLTASSVSGYPGGEAAVTLSATDQVRNTAGVQFDLNYDPSLVVTADDVTLGGFLSGTLAVNVVTPGVVRVAIAAAVGKNGPGTVAKVTFHLPSTAPLGKEYPVGISNLVLATGQGSVQANATGGKVTVAAKPAPVPIEGGLVSVNSVKARKGEVSAVVISVNEKITGLSGASFRLVYTMKTPSTTQDLEFVNAAKAGTLLPGAGPQVNATVAGEVRVALASAATANGPGTLVELPFKVPETAENGAVYSFELKDLLLSVNGQDHASAAEGGTLTVFHRLKGDVANVEPTADAGDDRVDTRDAIALLQMIIKIVQGTEEQYAAADANCDGEVTVTDVVKVLKIAVGLETACEEPTGSPAPL
ncbi:MAG: hypothetical protein KY468_08535 [Armatimonadetes bacterium]|nr:hypothetical protein [Armatimonadota bacterium]